VSRLRPLHPREIEGVLRKLRFTEAPKRGKGSHRAFVRKDEHGRTWLVVVPEHNPVPVGTISGILRQAGISRDQFLALLE
jgi:predicted RNA binding protein YcfA (HicA-like mRNA interferase family)